MPFASTKGTKESFVQATWLTGSFVPASTNTRSTNLSNQPLFFGGCTTESDRDHTTPQGGSGYARLCSNNGDGSVGETRVPAPATCHPAGPTMAVPRLHDWHSAASNIAHTEPSSSGGGAGGGGGGGGGARSSSQPTSGGKGTAANRRGQATQQSVYAGFGEGDNTDVNV